MDDEDEIDILSEFSLDNMLVKSEPEMACNLPLQGSVDLLHCDYGINTPSWLLDNPNTSWYGAGHEDASDSSLGFEDTQIEVKEAKGCFEAQPKADETGWTKKEQHLLQKGLEIFDRSAVRLSQFIGTKTPREVKHYLINHHAGKLTTASSEIIDQSIAADVIIPLEQRPAVPSAEEVQQMPQSLAEVIQSVSTARPTVRTVKVRQKRRRTSGKPPVDRSWQRHQKLRRQPPKKKRTPLAESPATANGEEETAEEMNTDEEVDIETSFSSPPPSSSSSSAAALPKTMTTVDSTRSDVLIEHKVEEPLPPPASPSSKVDELEYKFKDMPPEVVEAIQSLSRPTAEVQLDLEAVSEVERFMHAEFFEGRPTKTPCRYLKIRNYTLACWRRCRPAYLTKTHVRNGLKNCGDVNSIGRVHHYLEQIGAINFGCDQVQYQRPLHLLLAQPPSSSTSASPPTPGQKTTAGEEGGALLEQRSRDVSRAKLKRKFNKDGEGGYTMVHNEHGDIIDVTVINQEKPASSSAKPRGPAGGSVVELVACHSFRQQPPYSVRVDVAALVLMDVHAHSALTEVMGLLGGRFDPLAKTLTIARYVACRSLEQSGTHCDMCPVSQSEASELIHRQQLDVIGWFHSHPTFHPNPSQQDIATQLSMQAWFGAETPFVGVILSPFDHHSAASLASAYNCLIVDEESVPFRFSVALSADGLRLEELLLFAERIFDGSGGAAADFFRRPYFLDPDLTHLDKLLSSVKFHLAKCAGVTAAQTNAILSHVADICSCD